MGTLHQEDGGCYGKGEDADRSRFVCRMKNGRADGIGITVDGYGACVYEKGRISVGDFTKGVHDGEAYVYRPDTDSYFEGHYQNGKFSGDGTVYYQNGNYFKGVYSNGEWKEGTCYYYGEGWFDRTFKAGQIETGSMIRILENGIITREKYKNGKKL